MANGTCIGRAILAFISKACAGPAALPCADAGAGNDAMLMNVTMARQSIISSMRPIVRANLMPLQNASMRVSCNFAPCRHYNFASTTYSATFGDLPAVDVVKLREDTVAAIEAFDPSTWHTDPLQTHIAGKIYADGSLIDTIDAFEVVNGKQVVASGAVLDVGAQQHQIWRI
eukprot:SAG31_NODE_582_length_13925_cov_32.209967_2_plen_172_part_00